MLERLDEWRIGYGKGVSRTTAAQFLIEAGLQQFDSKDRIHITAGEKMIMAMLCDLYRGVDMNRVDLDPGFIISALTGGHYWALGWRYTGLFHGHQDSDKIVSEVANIMDMWSILESAYERFTSEQKNNVAKKLNSSDIRFLGFDGNNEGEHYGIARFLVEDLKRFERFNDRDLNSHMPSLDGYRRMLSVFESMRSRLSFNELTDSHVIEILKAEWVNQQ